MDSKRAGGIAIFGVIVLMLIWGLLNLLPNTVSAPGAHKVTDSTAQVAEAVGPEVLVTHTVKGDIHTYKGMIPTPTACHMLISSTSVAYSASTTVSVALSVKQPGPEEVCAQVITPQEFMTSVSSPETPQFVLTVDGARAKVIFKE